MYKKIPQSLLNLLGYKISEISELENLIDKTKKLNVLEKLKTSKKLIEKHPNIPFFYLQVAECLHRLCDPEKFRYFKKYGEIRSVWLKENKLDDLNIEFIWSGMFIGSLGNHYPVESLINASYPNSLEYYESCLSLPLYYDLSFNDQKYIINQLSNIIE